MIMNPIARKEISDSVRNRWVVGYAAVIGILGFLAAWFGLKTTGGMALQMFGRTAATITNLSLLIAPLVALILGASAIASERDRGTLQRLLAQPITTSELLLSKFFGLLVALAMATLLGFAPAALLIAIAAGLGPFVHFLIFPGITVLLVAAMCAVGMLVSSAAPTASKALGAAVVAWFAFVLLYDLILMGSLVVASMTTSMLISLVIANPVDAARILVMLSLEHDLHALGPAGTVLISSVGHVGATVVVIAILTAWTAIPLAFAVRRFRRIVFSSALPSGSKRTPVDTSYALAKATAAIPTEN